MKYHNFYIFLEKNLFLYLEKTVEEYNKYFGVGDSTKIAIDKAVFFTYYILNQASYRRKELVEGYVRIPSSILNKYLKKELHKYATFLKSKGILSVIPYSKKKSESFGYKILPTPPKVNKEKIIYEKYEFINMTYEKYLTKIIQKDNKHKQKQADRKTKHLTKWLNAKEIQIDWHLAFDYIENSKMSDDKKCQYSYSVNRIRFKQLTYSRSGEDNRLHSNLTNLPSGLREYLKHKDEKLVSLDIKSSQPYLLAGIFNLIINKRKEKIEKLKRGLKSKDIQDKLTSIMNSISLQTSVLEDFKLYIKLICDDDIYTFIGQHLDTNFKEKIKFKNGYRDKVYCPNLGHKKTTYFKDLRSYCKMLTLEFMYCSLNNNSRRIKEIRSIYPKEVVRFIEMFKYHKALDKKTVNTKREKQQIDKAKKMFPKFLQQLEAFIILDVITKELSNLFPEMFIATIHDSIIVPKTYEHKVKEFLEKRLFELLEIRAEIKVEYWQ